MDIINEPAAFCTQIRGVTVNIFVRDGQFFADGFSLRRSFSLSEGESRLISYIAKGGAGVATVGVSEGILTVEGEGLIVINHKEGAELRPILMSAPERDLIEVTAEGTLYRVECYGGKRSKIAVSKGAVWTHLPLLPLCNPSLRLIEGQRESIVELTASCPAGRYLAMISLSKGVVKLLLEEVGESILCRGNEVKVRRTLSDRRGRSIESVYTWEGAGFSLSRDIRYTREIAIPREETGRELLECVIARDDAALSAILSPEIGDPRALYDYFGEILSVETPLFPVSPGAVTAILRRDGRYIAATYDFDYDERGLVENIRPLDEEGEDRG